MTHTARCRLRVTKTTLTAHAIDGRLASWRQVAREGLWRDLLIGNGLSRHVWPAFSYDSLYERAELLNQADRALFQALQTENFEVVLNSLSIAGRTLQALRNPSAAALATRYRSVQRALAAAVRGAHIPLSEFPQPARLAIKATLRQYRWVFTTNYDLVLYWCAGAGESFQGFADYFYGDWLQFDPARTRLNPRVTRIVYLHGALHLLVDSDGATYKTHRSTSTLLEQFDKRDPHDPDRRPLIVAEGSAEEKAHTIHSNEYLSFALGRLADSRAPLVIYGLSLRDEDAHLIEALNVSRRRPLAVSIRPSTRKAIRARQAELRAALCAEHLLFFDASSHPLGVSDLAAISTDRNAP